MTPENINIIKRSFLHYKKPQDIIAKMYGSLFDGIYQNNREKYLAFLKEVEKDNRFGELEGILFDKFTEDFKLAHKEALKEYYGKVEMESNKPSEELPQHKAECLADQYQLWCKENPMGNLWGACYRASMDMYAWTMNQVYDKLTQLIICAQQGYTQGADDEMIKKHCVEILNE